MSLATDACVRQQVSLASRIVPSPDWFVGLDSFNLCIDGQWVDSVAIKVSAIAATMIGRWRWRSFACTPFD